MRYIRVQFCDYVREKYVCKTQGIQIGGKVVKRHGPYKSQTKDRISLRTYICIWRFIAVQINSMIPNDDGQQTTIQLDN